MWEEQEKGADLPNEAPVQPMPATAAPPVPEEMPAENPEGAFLSADRGGFFISALYGTQTA